MYLYIPYSSSGLKIYFSNLPLNGLSEFSFILKTAFLLSFSLVSYVLTLLIASYKEFAVKILCLIALI